MKVKQPRRRVLVPPNLFESRKHSFSQGISIKKPNTLVFVSGQASLDAEGKVVGKGDIVTQSLRAFRNVEVVLNEAGMTLRDVVKFSVYVTRRNDFFEVMKVRRRILGNEPFPASSMVQVRSLAYPQLLVEVEAIAAK